MNQNFTVAEKNTYKSKFILKDPGSAITHFIGFLFSIFLTPILIYRGKYLGADGICLASLAVFMISMILLYSASTIYHSFDISPRANKIMKKIDHMMIFILIAGSYTPICVIALHNKTGLFLLILVWALALIGIIFKFFWVTCPKWVSSVIYIGMGWICVLALPQIMKRLSASAFVWLLTGGIIYTIGGILYALKLTAFNHRFKHFGSHEIFHCFVMLGNLCHYIVVYFYLM